MNTTAIVATAVIVAGAWYWDSRSWRQKSREELIRMLESDDWRFHKAAIKEMRRRGEDVSVYLPRIVASLVAGSQIERTASTVTIKDCFPELAAEIHGYSPAADIEVCRAKAAPLLSKFPLGMPMSTITEGERRIAESKTIPRKVQMAGLFAFALGIVSLLRVLARAYATNLPMGKALFYGFLLLFWFFMAGGSLYFRSRWGFIGLLALVLVPLLGLFTLSVHLFRLALESSLTVSWPETIHCVIALLQFATTCVLLRFLLAKQVRDYVWKSAS